VLDEDSKAAIYIVEIALSLHRALFLWRSAKERIDYLDFIENKD